MKKSYSFCLKKDFVRQDKAESEVNYASFPICGMFLTIYIAACNFK